MPDPNIHASLIRYIARKQWWHVPPQDSEAYRKRGKFYSSTFAEAEFYGRPCDQPEHVIVTNPLVGDDHFIEVILFQKRYSEHWSDPEGGVTIEERLALDAKMKNTALEQGYDAIVLMSPKGFADYQASRKIPRSLELNIFIAEA